MWTDFWYFVGYETLPTRVECLVPVHRASSRPLGTKKIPALDLEVLETCMMP